MHEPPGTTADLAALSGLFGSSFDRLRTSSRYDVLTSTPQVQSRGVAGRVPGGTTISTISLRRLVHNAGLNSSSRSFIMTLVAVFPLIRRIVGDAGLGGNHETLESHALL
jgi:hypothetical protein